MSGRTKPRNFSAMREDRVVAMAEAHFGRSFGSKKVAVDALSTLPISAQYQLKKPVLAGSGVSKPGRQPPARGRKTKVSGFNNEIRGGVAPPSSDKLASARAEVVKRYARATTGLASKSKAQALTLMAKFAPTDVARSAGGAIGVSGIRKSVVPSKAELVLQYTEKFGVRPAAKIVRSKVLLKVALKSKGAAVVALAGAVVSLAAGTASSAAPARKVTGMAQKKKQNSLINDPLANVAAGSLLAFAAMRKNATPTRLGVALFGLGLITRSMFLDKAKSEPLKKNSGVRAPATPIVSNPAAKLKAVSGNSGKSTSSKDASFDSSVVAGATLVGVGAGNVAAGVHLAANSIIKGGAALSHGRVGLALKAVGWASAGIGLAAVGGINVSTGAKLITKSSKTTNSAKTSGAYIDDAARKKSTVSSTKSETGSGRRQVASVPKSPVTSYQRTYKSGAKAGVTETVKLK